MVLLTIVCMLVATFPYRISLLLVHTLVLSKLRTAYPFSSMSLHVFSINSRVCWVHGCYLTSVCCVYFFTLFLVCMNTTNVLVVSSFQIQVSFLNGRLCAHSWVKTTTLQWAVTQHRPSLFNEAHMWTHTGFHIDASIHLNNINLHSLQPASGLMPASLIL